MRTLWVTLLAAACAPAPTPEADSGTPFDAGSNVDAGTVDSGTAIDAGFTVDAGARFSLAIAGLDAGAGFFDIAPERDDAGVVWMSYSVVTNDAQWPTLRRVETHLARSLDEGLTWDERQAINPAQTVAISNQPVDGGIWVNEVSRLRRDDFAPEAERWVVLWHRYLLLPPPVPDDQSRQFQLGWLALKTAAAPEGPWSAERKLLVGTGYDTSQNTLIGVPEHSATDVSSQLSDCVAFTEPTLLAQPDGWVVALSCVGATTSRIVFLHRARATDTWTYLGAVLPASSAAALGFDHFTAPELVSIGTRTFLIVSPETSGLYKGCHAYELTSLNPPTVSAAALWTLGLGASDVGFAGACGYVDGLASGVLEGEVHAGPGGLPQFEVVGTRQGF